MKHDSNEVPIIQRRIVVSGNKGLFMVEKQQLFYLKTCVRLHAHVFILLCVYIVKKFVEGDECIWRIAVVKIVRSKKSMDLNITNHQILVSEY